MKRMSQRTNMPELLNRFMETSNIAIKPAGTRLHRLVIHRFLYSFGQCSDVATCVGKLLDSGVDVGVFNSTTIDRAHCVAQQPSLSCDFLYNPHTDRTCA